MDVVGRREADRKSRWLSFDRDGSLIEDLRAEWWWWWWSVDPRRDGWEPSGKDDGEDGPLDEESW